MTLVRISRSWRLFVVLTMMAMSLAIGPAARAATMIADGDIARLIAAIDTANSSGVPTVIELATGGTYTLTAVNNSTYGETGLPVITGNVTIKGHGALISRDTAAGTPSFRIAAVGSDGTLALENVTVQNGDNPSSHGGGIYNLGTLTLSGSTVRDNGATWTDGAMFGVGGGIYNDEGGHVTVTNSTVSGNRAGAGGGILSDRTATLTVDSSTLSGNSAELAEGGGIYNSDARQATVTNSVLSGNSAARSGGGIFNFGGPLVVANSTLSGNSASVGAAIDTFNATVTVTNSTISGNNAQTAGGGISNDSGSFSIGTVSVSNSTLSNNDAGSRGGGIINGSGGEMYVTNTTIYKNSALIGAGIVNAADSASGSGKLTVTSSTVSDNMARASDGGSIYNIGTTSLINTLLANRTGGDCRLFQPISDNGHNISVDDTCGFTSATSMSVTNPDLDPSGLQHNGGPTQTIALLSRSPAIDAGDDSVCASAAVGGADQRGITRPHGAHCDIGAFESETGFPNRPPDLTAPGQPTLVFPPFRTPNRGSFTLTWTAPVGADPDGDLLTYTLQHKDANDADYTTVASGVAATSFRFDGNNLIGTRTRFQAVEPEGTWHYRVIASDGQYSTAVSLSSGPIVVDRTRPTAPMASFTPAPAYATAMTVWYRDTVTVSFDGSSDPTLSDGSPGSGVVATAVSQTFSATGTFNFGGGARDAAGNVSLPTTGSVNVDASAPTVSITSPADSATYQLNEVVTANYNCADDGAGLASCNGTIGNDAAIDTSSTGTKLFTVTATDHVGHITEILVSYNVVVHNQAPLLATDQPLVTVDEGQTAINGIMVSDPNSDPVTLSASVGTVMHLGDDVGEWTFTPSDGPAQSQTVTITADDGQGGTHQVTFDLSVSNVAPSVGAITASIDPVQINTSVNASATFTDPGTADTHTAVWDWGDNTTSAGTVSETDGSGSVTGNHAYSTPGVYRVKLTVTDDDLDSGQSVFEYVVIYDPNGGFVTGGGWINSPEGAYVVDPTLTGRANFGFVAKYQKGATAPTGNTEFQFKAGDLNFHSSTYQWLVVAGAKAQFKGTGTINSQGNYGFMLTAIDGQISGGGGIDKFRIKIWVINEDGSDGLVVYDNQIGATDDADPSTVLGGGSISIKKP